MSSWDLIRVFVALNRAGSYEGAAQILGCDVSTTRRKILKLEAEIGRPLFTRGTSAFQLCVGHDALLDAARLMEAASLLFEQQSESARQTGSVRISTLNIFADLLIPDIVRFAAEAPEIVLEVTTEPGFVDIDREMVDIAIRLARPTRGSNGLKRIGNVAFGVYGSREYFARTAMRRHGEHDLLALCTHFPLHDHEFELAEKDWAKEGLGTVVARADTYMLLRDLCVGGAGLAFLPNFLARQDPDLVRYHPDTFRKTVGLWIVIRKDVSQIAKIRRCVRLIETAFDKLAPRLVDESLLWSHQNAEAIEQDETRLEPTLQCPIPPGHIAKH